MAFTFPVLDTAPLAALCIHRIARHMAPTQRHRSHSPALGTSRTKAGWGLFSVPVSSLQFATRMRPSVQFRSGDYFGTVIGRTDHNALTFLALGYHHPV